MPSVISLQPRSLSVSPDEIARYAGGARYRMDASAEKTAAAAIEEACDLIRPAFIYRVDPLRGFEDGYAVLRGEAKFPLPADVSDHGTKYLASCIATIGEKLEERTGRLASSGRMLDSLFLDAAGVAFLEALSTKAFQTLAELARKERLHIGCRCVPGCGHWDISLQRRIFELVDGSAIRVRLNESNVMVPGKSKSFFVPWTARPSRVTGDKCRSCTLPQCTFRRAAHRGGEDR
ncbi:MAG: hypothetical protein LLG06_10485 [Desulfobacteraceae bacterium]|nr:hypothetical protein [Desulfobacteraceae bacterium]